MVDTALASKLKPAAHFAALDGSVPTSVTEKNTVMDFPLVMKFVNCRLFYVSKVLAQQL